MLFRSTNYKCALWGSSISKDTATNVGQYRQNFHVVIAASNGYDKTPAVLPDVPAGFTFTANITTQAVTLAGSFSLGSEFFAGPFDPSLCGFYATAQTSANKAYAQSKGLKSYQPCNSFNAYTVYKSGFAWGTYCTLFNKQVDASFAGNVTATSGGFTYTVGGSYIYSLTQQDPGTL